MKQSGQLFEIGQAVTPLSPDNWESACGNIKPTNPSRFGKVYHVAKYIYGPLGWCIILKELAPDWAWLQTDFAPVMSDDEFCTLYGTIKQPETICVNSTFITQKQAKIQRPGSRFYLPKMFNKIVNALTQIDSKMYLLSYGKLRQFRTFSILHFTLPPPHSDPIGKILVY